MCKVSEGHLLHSFSSFFFQLFFSRLFHIQAWLQGEGRVLGERGGAVMVMVMVHKGTTTELNDGEYRDEIV